MRASESYKYEMGKMLQKNIYCCPDKKGTSEKGSLTNPGKGLLGLMRGGGFILKNVLTYLMRILCHSTFGKLLLKS